MSTDHHTPHPFLGPVTSPAFNQRLGELDAAINAVMTAGLVEAGTTLDAQALAGQKVLPVVTTVGFAVGDAVWVGTPGSGIQEAGVIASISAGVSLTLVANLVNTHVIGSTVSRSPAELVDARGTAATLKQRLEWLGLGIYNVAAFGAAGDGVADDWSAIQGACDAASAAGGGKVVVPSGRYRTTQAVVVSRGVQLVGSGVTNTVIVSGEGVSGIAVLGDGVTLVNELSIRDLTIENGSINPGTQILLDLQFCAERSVIVRDLLLDGQDHACVGLRLYNSWGFNLDDLSFIRFASTTLPALELRSTSGTGGGGDPMNTIGINYARWNECKIACHIGNTDDVAPGPVHAIVFLNPRVKNTTMDVNSYGIRGRTNQIWNVAIINGFFEDVARPIVATGFNWRIENPFIEHATTGIAFETGGGHVAENVSFSSPAGNDIGTGVHFKSTLTEPCRLGSYTIVPGSADFPVLSNEAGLLCAPVALVPESGAATVILANLAVADRAVYMPVSVEQAVVVIGVRLVVGVAAGNISVALIDSAGKRLATSGAVACPAAGNQQVSFTSSAYIPPGVYYLALSSTSLTATFGQTVGSGLNTTGLARYKAASHPIPDPVTFDGVTNIALAIIGRVSGSYA